MSDINLTEKVSVNVNTQTLSQIDMLVDNGFFSNRSDFINHALRQELTAQRANLDRLIAQNDDSATDGKWWFFGINSLDAGRVNELYAQGATVTLSGYGVFSIDENVDEQKLFKVLQSIDVKGKVLASDNVKRHYGL